jgi:hypothetical protein
VPQQPVTQPADPSMSIPAQFDNHKTPPNGAKSPEAVPIEPVLPIKPSKLPPKPSNLPPKPSQTREPKAPKAPVGDVRWSSRLEKQGKSSVDNLLSGYFPLTGLGSGHKGLASPPVSPSKKGKELVLHSSSALNRCLGKRKRSSAPPKSRKKRTTTLNTVAKGKEIVIHDENEQLPVMVCSS